MIVASPGYGGDLLGAMHTSIAIAAAQGRRSSQVRVRIPLWTLLLVRRCLTAIATGFWHFCTRALRSDSFLVRLHALVQKSSNPGSFAEGCVGSRQ